MFKQGTRIKIINIKPSYYMRNVKIGDTGTVLFDVDVICQMDKNNCTYILPIESVKRLHVKKVQASTKE
jgi:hypothetical protein